MGLAGGSSDEEMSDASVAKLPKKKKAMKKKVSRHR